MAIKRQSREFKIGSISVNRSDNSSGSVANAIVNSANLLYQRAYERAKENAIEYGQKAAAEAPLDEITALDPNTKLPDAMKYSGAMGRFAKQSFDNVLIRRFEGAIRDDIQAKKNELLQTYGDSANGVAQFEQVFSQYLDGIGANASGFYKQAVVDHGASEMEDGRSRLRVAQIARMQAQAKAALAKRKAKFLEDQFNQGMRETDPALEAFGGYGGDGVHDYYKQAREISSEIVDYAGIGATLPSQRKSVLEEGRAAFSKGAVTRLLQNPEFAKQSGVMFQFFESGGSPDLKSLLSPAAQDAINEIEALYSAEDPIDWLKIADANKDTFSAASRAGEIYSKVEAAQVAASEQAQKDSIVYSTVGLDQRLNSQYFGTLGEIGGTLQIQNEIQALNEAVRNVDPAVVGRDAYNAYISKVQEAKKRISEGLIRREASFLSQDDPTGAKMEKFAAAIGGGDLYAAFDFMTEVGFKKFTSIYDPANASSLKEIITNYSSSQKVDRNIRLEQKKISLMQAKGTLVSQLNNPKIDPAEKIYLVASFHETFGQDKEVAEQYAGVRNDILPLIDRVQQEEANRRYKNSAKTITNNTSLDSVDSSLNALTRNGKFNGQSDETIQADAQKIVDAAANSAILKATSMFPEDSIGVQQIQLMSEYAESGVASPNLEDGAKSIVDAALNVSKNVLGVVIKPDSKKLSEALGGKANGVASSIEKTAKANDQAKMVDAVLKGKPVLNPDSQNVRASYGHTVAIESGYADGLLPTDLFEKPSSELTPEDGVALTLIKNNRNIVPEVFVNSAQRARLGLLDGQSLMTFLTHARENLYTLDPSGRSILNAGVVAALGDKAADIEVLIEAASLAPRGREAEYATLIADQLRQPMNNETFKAITDFDSPEMLLSNIGASEALIRELAPVARGYASLYGANAKSQLEASYKARFTQRSNGYYAYTGESTAPYMPDSFGIDAKTFESGVAALVRLMSTPKKPLYFREDSSFGGVSIEDMQAAAAALPAQILFDSFGNVTEAITATRVADRVFYGPTPSSTAARPQWMLFSANEFGHVTPVPNSIFDLSTPEIAAALDGTLGQVIGPQRLPVGSIPEAEAVEMATPEQKATREKRIQETTTRNQPRYPAATPKPSPRADSALVKSVGSLLGPKSNAAKIVGNFNQIESAQKAQSEITKVIKDAEALPRTQGRDDLLNRLYEMRDALKGK